MASDRARDEYIAEHGYETISLKPKERGYQEEVKRLVERVDIAMKMVESDEWEVAVSAEVRSSSTNQMTISPFRSGGLGGFGYTSTGAHYSTRNTRRH